MSQKKTTTKYRNYGLLGVPTEMYYGHETPVFPGCFDSRESAEIAISDKDGLLGEFIILPVTVKA